MLLVLMAQAAAATAPAAIEPSQPGVASYPPSFFAAQHPNTARDMIDRLPGFSFDGGASVRGFEGAAGNVLIDGERPATKTDPLDDILRRLPASQVERIDVIRGGAPGIDMQGKSVLANVVRRKNSGLHASFAVSGDYVPDGRTPSVARAEVSGGSGGRKWELAGLGGTGFDDTLGDGPGDHAFADGRPPLKSQITSRADVSAGQASGAYETPLFGGKVRANGRFREDTYKFSEEVRQVSPSLSLDGSRQTDKSRQAEIGGEFTRPLGPASLELVALRNWRDVDTDSVAGALSDVERFTLAQHTIETIGRSVVKYSLNDQLSFEAGGETAENTLDSKTAFSISGMSVALPAANVQVRERRQEAFLKGVWRPLSQWTIDAGLRFERSEISSKGDVTLGKTLQFTKPRLTLAWAPRDSRQVRVRLEREVGQLDFNDFVASTNLSSGAGVTAGNPDLDPEQAWVTEASFEQRFWGGGDLTLSARNYELTDVVDRGPAAAPDGSLFDRPANIGKGRKQELAIALTLPLDRIGLKNGLLKGEMTRNYSSVTDPTTGAEREISGLRPIVWSLNFSHDLPEHRLTWGVDAQSGWRRTFYRFNLIQTDKLQTWVRPFVEWRPRPDLSLRLEAPDATGRAFRHTLQLFPGSRAIAGAPDVDDRKLRVGRQLYFRIRKTFGS